MRLSRVRIAIAAVEHFNPHITQIKFHTDHLFGGNSVVIAQKRQFRDPTGRPCHYWDARDCEDRYRNATLTHLTGKARSFWQHRNLSVPQGCARAGIINFLREQNVQAILAEFGTSALRIAPVAREMGLPVIAYFRGADASAHLRQPFRIESYKRLMPNLAAAVSVSQFLLDNLAKHGIIPLESHVIPSGVDTARYLPAIKQSGLHLAVGRFVEKKRPDITIRAFCSAAHKRPDAVLEMIGDGPMLAECRTLVQKLGMGERVIFLGRQPHDFVRQRMAEAEVFLQHSVTGRNGDTEGLPTSVQEAMSGAAVVISTRHAGIPEAVIEGETGFLVDEGDESQFSAAIERVMMGGSQLQMIAKRARAEAVARFDNHRLVARLQDVIQEIVRRH